MPPFPQEDILTDHGDSIIRAQDLTKRFGDLVAVDHISFSVRSGECFGFLGPNGAGKTVTARMIYGFSPLTEGVLMVLGMDVSRDSRRIKCQIGVVPQENNLDPELRVLGNLLVYARYFDIPRSVALERAQESLELFQLWDNRDSEVEELSGGMKRRLVIARALINEPSILILDEPTTGLDPQARHLVWDKMRYLQARGVTILLTTHYMYEAAELCDRLVVMDRGSILDEGSPGQLMERHVARDVLELRMDGQSFQPVLRQVEGRARVVESAGHTLYIFTDDGDGLRRDLQIPQGAQLYQRPANLEDVFMRLTGRGLRHKQ
jgi:lipooligosaccharide transport system ATP-binding protein